MRIIFELYRENAKIADWVADGAVWSGPFSVNRKPVDTLAAVDKLWLTKGLLAKYRTSFD